MLFADVVLSPGGVISWIVVGLISGWLAGVAFQGSGYGIFGDIVLGLVGALVGGFVAGFFITGEAGFVGSIIVAFLGAALVIGIARAVTPGRSARL